ncbi:MAG: hypothetical protein DI601_00365 [Azospirillum brasilense]|nr:MAG: hypothetical protein DI601_00365 [Azospirillum brasilense]
MASILQRKTKEDVAYFTANVRLKGVRLARSFPTRKEAERWAIRVEGAIEDATPTRPFNRADFLEEKASVPVVQAPAPAVAADPQGRAAGAEDDVDAGPVADDMAAEDHHEKPHPAWSLRRAMQHYLEHVTPGKKGWEAETNRILAWTTAADRLAIAEHDVDASRRGKGEPDPAAVIEMVFVRHRVNIGSIRLDRLQATDIQPLVSARNRAGLAATTIRNEFYLVRAIYTHASTAPYADGSGGWGLQISSNLDRVKLPDPPEHRDRRLHVGEWDRLQAALEKGPDPLQMQVLTTVLLETACRLSEPLDLDWKDVEHLEEGMSLRLRRTKNGSARRVYLSSRARNILATLPREKGKPVFSMTRGDVEYRWKIACKAAAIEDLHMHDLRHEGLSRMAAKGMPLQHLMSQSGHRDARTLARYLNTSPAEIVKMLD